MRKLGLALVLLAGAHAHADPFIELGGGLALPVSDDDYTAYAEPSLKLAARIGSSGATLGGMGSIDWTPVSDDLEFVSFNRVRILGHVQVRSQVGPKLQIVGRFGAGIDYIHASTDATILGIRFEGSDSDVGLALEAAGGLWFGVGGGSTQVGIELALPISLHSSEGNPQNPNDPDDAEFDYTGIDIDVLAAVRLRL